MRSVRGEIRSPILIAAAMAALLAACGAVYYRVQSQHLRDGTEADLEAIARLKADRIAEWRAERLADARVLADSQFLVRGISHWMREPDPETTEMILARFRSMQIHHGYEDIFLVDAAGKVRLSLAADGGPLHEEAAGSVAEAIRDRKSVLTDLHAANGRPHIGAVAPLFDSTNAGMESVGAVVLQSDAQQFLFPLVQSWPVPSGTAETLLVRRDDDHVLFLNELRHRTNTALKLRIPLTETNVPAVRAVLGGNGVIRGRDYRGADVLSVIKAIPESPWAMVAKVDAGEALAVWRMNSTILVALVFAAVALAGVGGLAGWLQNARAHYRSLYESEVALRRAEGRHSATLMSIGDGVISTGADGRVDVLNPVAESLTGWCQAEARGRPIEEVFRIVNEETRATVESPVVRVMREGVVVGLANHTVLIARDGAEHPIADSGAPVRDPDGSISGAVMVFRDQGAERRAQGILRDSEAKYRMLFQNLTAGFALHEILLDDQGRPRDYRFLEVNPAFERLTGLRAADIVGRTVLEVLPGTESHWIETYGRVALTGEPVEFEQQHAPLNRHYRVVAYSPGHGLFAVVFEDITERKSAAVERDRLALAIEQAAEAVVITDAAATIQYVNPAFEAISGYTRDEVVGRNPRILKSGQHDAAFYRGLWDTLSAGRTWTGRMVNRRKAGTTYTEEATISPVRDAAGTVVNYVAVKRDVTHELEMEDQLVQARKMEAIGRLVGGVAHDFNNMLQTILGYGEMTIRVVQPEGPVFENLQEMQKAGRRAADLTRQLLAFARRQTVAPRVLNMNDVVESMLKMLRRLIGEDIDLAWMPGAHLWNVRIDPAQVDQILANLAVNARDAIAGDGKVVIETSNMRVDEAYCASRPEAVPGDYVVMTVSDDGCGMDANTVSHLFEPFFTTKAMGRGTGLGLATVYGIVKQANGFINVYSEPRMGTTFRIYLPRHKGEAEAVPGADEGSMAVGGSETILLVEDESGILEMGRLMLSRLGYRMITAATPEEAIRLAAGYADTIHLLLTDVVLPGMNGKVLARHLAESRPGMKVLYMSGYTANAIARRGVLDDGVHFLQKPFASRELARKVREVLNG